MAIRVIFSNYEDTIINSLDDIKNNIFLSGDFIFKNKIVKILIKKLKNNIQVNILVKRSIFDRSDINYILLKKHGANFIFIEFDENLHFLFQKTYIIDTSILFICGRRGDNFDAITMIDDNQYFIDIYLNFLNNLLFKSKKEKQYLYESNLINSQLNLIMNLIQLKLFDKIKDPLMILLSMKENFNIYSIINSLNNENYGESLNLISKYLLPSNDLVYVEDNEINIYKYKLDILYIKLELLKIQKNEFEKKIISFSEKYKIALGGSIEKLNILQNQYLELMEKFIDQNIFEIKNDIFISKNTIVNDNLSKIDKKLLKNLYRKACNLCHPDKVIDEKKEEAHKFFIKLQIAYKCQDFEKIEIIYKQLTSRSYTKKRLVALTKIDLLKNSIELMQSDIADLSSNFAEVLSSEAGEMLIYIEKSYKNWNSYFEEQKQIYEQEIGEFNLNINGYN